MIMSIGELLNPKNFEVAEWEISPEMVASAKEEFKLCNPSNRKGTTEQKSARLDSFFEQEIIELNRSLDSIIQKVWSPLSLARPPFSSFSFTREKISRRGASFHVGEQELRATFENLVRLRLMFHKLTRTILYIENLYQNHDLCIESFQTLAQAHKDILRVEDLRPWVRITMPSPDFELRQEIYTVPANSYYLVLLEEKVNNLEVHQDQILREKESEAGVEDRAYIL